MRRWKQAVDLELQLLFVILIWKSAVEARKITVRSGHFGKHLYFEVLLASCAVVLAQWQLLL